MATTKRNVRVLFFMASWTGKDPAGLVAKDS
jgi:hypothetical protein